MSPTASFILRPGREKSLELRHRWIFSGALQNWPAEYEDGDVAHVYSSTREWLALAYFHTGHSLAGRVLSFASQNLDEVLPEAIQKAWQRRQAFFPDARVTNSFRVVNGEVDGLPGLILDWYNGTAVVQITTLGMEKLQPRLFQAIETVLAPEALLEKSVGSFRKREGLNDVVKWHKGMPGARHFRESGWNFTADLETGQKTGFFLDQRAMRQRVSELARDRHVLNMFSYSGGFTVAALAGGAKRVESVDISGQAIAEAQANVALNHQPHWGEAVYSQADAFTFLRESDWKSSFVILDPPAFAKKRSDVPAALRGYRELNTTALKKIEPNSYLLTCSCSYSVDESSFEKIIFQSAVAAGRQVFVLEKHRHAADHLMSVYHPESHYLKSLLLWID